MGKRVVAFRAPTMSHPVEKQPRRGAEGARGHVVVHKDLGWDPSGHRCRGRGPPPALLSSPAPSLPHAGITELIKIGRKKLNLLLLSFCTVSGWASSRANVASRPEGEESAEPEKSGRSADGRLERSAGGRRWGHRGTQRLPRLGARGVAAASFFFFGVQPLLLAAGPASLSASLPRRRQRDISGVLPPAGQRLHRPARQPAHAQHVGGQMRGLLH